MRNRVNVRLIADENKLLKAVAKVSFRYSEIVNEDLVMVRAARAKIKLNKPIAVSFAILEISKFIMYEFYYGYLKNKYQDRCSLLFTDTDSLCCEIETEDLYQDMAENSELLIRATSRRIIRCIPLRTTAFLENLRAKPARWHPQNLSVCARKCTAWTVGRSRRRKPRAYRNITSKNMYATANMWRFCETFDGLRRANFAHSDRRIM